jgi:hypothetical protein
LPCSFFTLFLRNMATWYRTGNIFQRRRYKKKSDEINAEKLNIRYREDDVENYTLRIMCTLYLVLLWRLNQNEVVGTWNMLGRDEKREMHNFSRKTKGNETTWET